MIAIACVNSALLGDSVATRRYIIKKELRMVAMAGTLLGYFAFAWIPFVVYQFYTINQCGEAIRDGWIDCEPNRYIRCGKVYIYIYKPTRKPLNITMIIVSVPFSSSLKLR